MALSKKQRSEILKLDIFEVDENNQQVFSEANEKIVLEALEDFEDNEATVLGRIKDNEKKLSRLQVLADNDKKIGKKLKVRLLSLEEEIKSDKSLYENWIAKTIQLLNNKYLDFVEAKYSEQIDEYLKQVEEE